MIIGNLRVKQIHITDQDGAILATISDEYIISLKEIKVESIDIAYAGPEDSGSRETRQYTPCYLNNCEKIGDTTPKLIEQARLEEIEQEDTE